MTNDELRELCDRLGGWIDDASISALHELIEGNEQLGKVRRVLLEKTVKLETGIERLKAENYVSSNIIANLKDENKRLLKCKQCLDHLCTKQTGYWLPCEGCLFRKELTNDV